MYCCRDAEGQTKWLGPSRYVRWKIQFARLLNRNSGMPLLDRLRTGITSPTGTTNHNLPEEWISLSVAIGMDVERQALPQSSHHQSQRGGSENHIVGGEDHTLWPEMLSICPQDCVDA